MKYLVTYGKPRYLGIIEYENELPRGEKIIAETVRGDELAVVAGAITDEQEAAYRAICNTSEHGDGMVKPPEPAVNDASFIDIASDDEIANDLLCRKEERSVLEEARRILPAHHLDMKLIDVEYIYEKRKLFFYYASENRVDFRALVRDLARVFRTRIEMRQIGSRDEAKLIRGVAPCGRPCCCGDWLVQFAPIGIKMVKEQNLALNPTKISGLCGRLMCCLSFEHETYSAAWEGLPAAGTKIKIPDGNVIISGIDLPTESVVCTLPSGGQIKVPKARFEEFKATVEAGRQWATDADAKEADSAASKVQAEHPNVKQTVPEPLALPVEIKEEPAEQAHKRHRRRKKPNFIGGEPDAKSTEQTEDGNRTAAIPENSNKDKQQSEESHAPAAHSKKHKKHKKKTDTEAV